MSHLRLFTNEFAQLRQSYKTPRYPVVLCHGLLGWDRVRLLPVSAPVDIGISYWHGIKEALAQRGVTVISGNVAPVGSIEVRAQMLEHVILRRAKSMGLLDPISTSGTQTLPVNLLGHSMGGLDARYLTSVLKPKAIRVKSIVSVVTPHRGSPFADLCFEKLPHRTVGQMRRLLKLFGLHDSRGFDELTTYNMKEKFNPYVPDLEGVKYMSFGARFKPTWMSPFRTSWEYINSIEGDNDGLVSIQSAQWGEYIGTLEHCDHLDVVNLPGLKRYFIPPSFNAVALYLHITNDLAEHGL